MPSTTQLQNLATIAPGHTIIIKGYFGSAEVVSVDHIKGSLVAKTDKLKPSGASKPIVKETQTFKFNMIFHNQGVN